ncbi:hypothetical protein BC826DRAFT_430906 [Russula brevipes]|nr:hypothetical protein BC826DRAFT_430906 [Russula brevipes]
MVLLMVSTSSSVCAGHRLSVNHLYEIKLNRQTGISIFNLNHKSWDRDGRNSGAPGCPFLKQNKVQQCYAYTATGTWIAPRTEDTLDTVTTHEADPEVAWQRLQRQCNIDTSDRALHRSCLQA